MSPTMTVQESAKQTRQEEIAFAEGKLQFYQDGVAKWRPILQALKGKDGVAKARGGNGAKATTRTRKRTATGATASVDALLAFMTPGRPYTSKFLAQAIDCSPNTVLRRLKEMQKAGKIKRTGKGVDTRWTLR